MRINEMNYLCSKYPVQINCQSLESPINTCFVLHLNPFCQRILYVGSLFVYLLRD